MALGPGQDTTAALHRIADFVGTIGLAATILRNRWWDVSFNLTGRGIITHPTGQSTAILSSIVSFDSVDYRLLIAADG